MLPRADNLGARPLAYVEAPAPVSGSADARQEVYHRLNQIALGQQVPAKVLERLADGTFLVRVADAAARMSLPVGAKVGDELSMTLVERQPRPTFLLGADAHVQAGDARATLSPAARLIDSLLHSAQQNGGSTAVTGRAPVMPGPGADVAQMTAALQDTVGASGLFYESHLAEWAAGGRPLAALLREPQAGAGGPAANGGAEAALLRHLASQWIASGRPLAELAAELQARTGATQQPATETQLNRLLQQLSDAPDALAPGEQGMLDPQSAQLIHAQLNTLETQRLAWHGELWPGQKIEWEVGRDGSKGDGPQQEQQENWQSTMKFELPNLGQVSATLHLAGERVSIQVRTESVDSAALLRAHGDELALALDAAGSPLDALVVNDGSQA